MKFKTNTWDIDGLYFVGWQERYEQFLRYNKTSYLCVNDNLNNPTKYKFTSYNHLTKVDKKIAKKLNILC